MVRLLSICIDTVSATVVLLPVMVILRCIFFRHHGWKKVIFVYIFAVYLSAVFTIVGIPDINTLTFNAEFNWIPIIDIINSPLEYVMNSVLNILLFVPLGFLLPAIWEEYDSLKNVFLVGLGLSFMIEILQMFTFRLTDIDDLLTNTVGTILGYCLLKLFYKKFPKISPKQLQASSKKYESFLVCGTVFILMFTIQPLISGALWEHVLSSSLWEKIR